MDKGFSQEAVASSAGVNTSCISAYENGRWFPRPETARRIAMKLGVTEQEVIAAVIKTRAQMRTKK